MYSRNTSGRGVQRRVPERRQAEIIPERQEPVEEEQLTDEISELESGLPEPPPNYRGMIYDKNGSFYSGMNAEGIERLVNNDSSYSDRRRVPPRRPDRTAFSHFNPPLKAVDKQQESGLRKIIEGLGERSFEPEDVLICAMIMLMLNSKSEDDILMVLVLMMLL